MSGLTQLAIPTQPPRLMRGINVDPDTGSTPVAQSQFEEQRNKAFNMLDNHTTTYTNSQIDDLLRHIGGISPYTDAGKAEMNDIFQDICNHLEAATPFMDTLSPMGTPMSLAPTSPR